jgi:hypothetical protein
VVFIHEPVSQEFVKRLSNSEHLSQIHEKQQLLARVISELETALVGVELLLRRPVLHRPLQLQLFD